MSITVIVEMTAAPGRRDELEAVLHELLAAPFKATLVQLA